MLSSAAQSHQQRKNVDLAAAAVAIGWWLMRNTTLRRRETVFSQTKDDESSQQSSRSSERPISPTPLCSTSLASAALFLYVLQHAVRISTYLPTYYSLLYSIRSPFIQCVMLSFILLTMFWIVLLIKGRCCPVAFCLFFVDVSEILHEDDPDELFRP